MMQKRGNFIILIVGFLLVGFLVTTPVKTSAQETNKNALCHLLPSGSIQNSVVYQPGVDAYGKPVAPADFQSPTDVEGDIIKVPLTVDFAERVQRLAGMGTEINAPLGMVEIHPNGQVKYNGEDWTKSVKTLCGKSHKEVTVDIIEVEPTIAPTMEAPVSPIAPVATAVEQPLPNKLAADEVSARITQPVIHDPMVSKPATPIQPLVGTPKGALKKNDSDVIKGQEFRDYNE